MLGMLDLEIIVLLLPIFTLNLTLSDRHIDVSWLRMFIPSLQHEIPVIGLKRRVCGLYHLAFTMQKISIR